MCGPSYNEGILFLSPALQKTKTKKKKKRQAPEGVIREGASYQAEVPREPNVREGLRDRADQLLWSAGTAASAVAWLPPDPRATSPSLLPQPRHHKFYRPNKARMGPSWCLMHPTVELSVAYVLEWARMACKRVRLDVRKAACDPVREEEGHVSVEE